MDTTRLLDFLIPNLPCFIWVVIIYFPWCWSFSLDIFMCFSGLLGWSWWLPTYIPRSYTHIQDPLLGRPQNYQDPCLRHFRVSLLTLMLLVANLANSKWCKKHVKWLKPWQMGIHLRVVSESYPMNTNMTGFRWFSKIFASLCFGRKQPQHWKG